MMLKDMSRVFGRTAARVLCLAIFGLRIAQAQGQPGPPARPDHAACRDPHPYPVCGQYFLYEMTGTTRLSGTETETPGCNGVCVRPALPAWLAWELGWMKNFGRTRTFGASLQIGGSEEGVRIAAKARHRSWLPYNLVVDASAGPLMTQLQGAGGAEGISETYGLTGDVGLGVARIGVLTLGGDVANQKGKRASALHLGARLESRGALVGSALAIVGSLIVMAALSDTHY